MSGKIYKGSIAEITVPMFPKCYTGETDNLVVDFYVDGDTAQTSIEFSISAGTITLDEYFNGTVVFQEAELGVLPDGLLKYTTTCDEYIKEWETRYFICTPQNFTPVEYITSENVEQIIETEMVDYLTKSEAEETYATKSEIPSVSGYTTSAQVQTMIASATTGFTTTGQVQSMITTATSQFMTSAQVDTKLEDYAKLTDIPSLDGYATELYVDNAVADCPTSSTISTIWLGTQQEYDAIPTKDNATLYIIK